MIENFTSKKQPFAGVFFNIMGSIRQPLIVLDNDLEVLKANYAFYQTFDIKPEETEGQLIYDLGNRQWDIPRLKELLQGVLPDNSEINNFEVEHDFAAIGRKIMRLNASGSRASRARLDLILLSIEDVTERENQKNVLEALVNQRTAELVVARAEAEERKKTAEAALAEILKLKEQLERKRPTCRKRLSWRTITRKLSVRAMRSNMCSIK